MVCFFFAGWAFEDYEKEGINGYTNSLAVPINTRTQSQPSNNDSSSKLNLPRRALSNRTTLIGTLFVFSYHGAEVSEQDWLISYLIDYHSNDPSRIGYATAGFWAETAIDRFTLTHLASLIDKKTFVAALTVGVIAFQLLAWFIPNVIGGAVAVSFLGFLLGPAYPCATTVLSRLLPAEIQMSAISFITTAGSSGGAVVPFTTGTLVRLSGLVLFAWGFFAMMLGCWVALPGARKRVG